MRDWDAMPGLDPGRVAEVLVTPAGDGPDRRGSGYRVSPATVLTAAHVVGGAGPVGFGRVGERDAVIAASAI